MGPVWCWVMSEVVCRRGRGFGGRSIGCRLGELRVGMNAFQV